MNTNSASLFDSSLKTITTLVEQVHTWPVSVALFMSLIILGSALQKAEYFPNKTIPLIMLFAGVALNVLVGDPAQIPPTQRYPMVIYGMWGFIIGFLAWMAHVTVLRKFRKYVPLVNGDTHTTIIEKDNVQTTTVIRTKHNPKEDDR